MTGQFGRGPPPRPQSLEGSPAPFSLHPAPFGRAPPRWSGLRESGCRATPSPFLSAGAIGGVHGGWAHGAHVRGRWCALTHAPSGIAPLSARNPRGRFRVVPPHPSRPLRSRYARPPRHFHPLWLPRSSATIQFQETKSIVLSSTGRWTILSLKSNCRNQQRTKNQCGGSAPTPPPP